MTTSRSSASRILTLVTAGTLPIVVAALTACAPPDSAVPRSAELQPIPGDALVELGLVRADWEGFDLELSPGEWTLQGAVEFAPPGAMEDEWPHGVPASAAHHSDALPPTDDTSRGFIVVDLVGEQSYRVTVPATTVEALAGIWDLTPAFEPEDVGDELQPAPSDPAGLAGRAPTVEGISDDGIDNRVQVTPGAEASFPLTTIAMKNAEAVPEVDLCSGVLIGDQTILTAAHCLMDAGNDDYQRLYTTDDFGWTAARNGANTPYAPGPIKQFYVPEEYTTPGQSSWWYRSYDYAVVTLKSPPVPITAPGPAQSMERTWLTDYGFFTHFHHGYPDCGSANPPSPCVNFGMYTHPGGCAVVAEPANIVTENGLDVLIRTSCDISEGHSGGPFWFLRPGTQVPYTTAVELYCAGEASAYNSGFRRMTQVSTDNVSFWQCLGVPCL